VSVGDAYNRIIAETSYRLSNATLWQKLKYALNKCACTIDQELTDAAACAPGRRYMCSHQMAALFCVKWHHGRSKLWHQKTPHRLRRFKSD